MANLACTAQWKMRWTSKWLAYERTRSSECSAWRTIWSSQNTPKQLYWIGGGAWWKPCLFFIHISSAGWSNWKHLPTVVQRYAKSSTKNNLNFYHTPTVGAR